MIFQIPWDSKISFEPPFSDRRFEWHLFVPPQSPPAAKPEGQVHIPLCRSAAEAPRETGGKRIFGGLLLYVALLHLHEPVIGANPS